MLVRVQVQGPDNLPHELDIEAASEAEAMRVVASRGARVLAVRGRTGQAVPRVAGGRASFPTLLFTQELLALLDAGLNLSEALATLHAKERKPRAEAVLGDLLRALRQGRNFSDALAAWPQYFPDVYVATARASERTGDLGKALTRYIAYQVRFEDIRRKVVAAAIYPAMLLLVGGCVLLFLLGYVVPRFSAVYDSAGRDLPWLSLVLVRFGKFVNAHWAVVLGIAGAGAGMLGYLMSQPAWRARAAAGLLRVPALSRRAEEFRLTRFYRAVGLLLSAGIPLTKSMQMVAGLLAPSQQLRLDKARRQVEEGLPLSTALVGNALATPVAESLLKVGESTGRLGDMLDRTAAFHDEELARWIDWASRLLEPVLMSVIGLVIGTVVVLMYIPIFELAGSLS
jgi:general secretion pathway protein F